MIAKLNKRALLENPTVVKSASGGTTLTWEELATVWAEFTVMGEELTDNPQSEVEVRGTVRLRYSTDVNTITKDTRVTIEGVKYSIYSLVSDGKREYITLKVKGVNNGIQI
jgi:SPP1 family predicted phage head-tail adaptor